MAAMTTSSCQRPQDSRGNQSARGGGRALALPVIEGSGNANPVSSLSGPRSLSAVKMMRLSVTDVCNLRCLYCMPEEGVEWLPKSNILSFEEIAAIVRAAASAGVTHFKLTGGEPTARRDLPVLVEMLRKIPGVEDLSLTTNGILLGANASGETPLLEKLFAAGLRRITFSLDSLRPERFAKITRGGDFRKVWSAIERSIAMGFEKVKINVVAMRGMNEDEVADFAALTRTMPVTVRFIEFMPLGQSGLTDNPEAALLPEIETRRLIEAAHGPLSPIRRETEAGIGPAKVWTLPDAAGRLGFISAMSHPFCETCNRLRLTPDGLMRSCLFDGGEVDLKPILRGGDLNPVQITPASGDLVSLDERLVQAFSTCVIMKPDTHSQHGNKAMSRIGG
jgi:GTP 3',8-cyclase